MRSATMGHEYAGESAAIPRRLTHILAPHFDWLLLRWMRREGACHAALVGRLRHDGWRGRRGKRWGGRVALEPQLVSVSAEAETLALALAAATERAVVRCGLGFAVFAGDAGPCGQLAGDALDDEVAASGVATGRA